MPTAELQTIQERVSSYCQGSVARRAARAYAERTEDPPPGGRIFVDPLTGDDATGVGTSTSPYKTLTHALRRIHAPGTGPAQTWEINLAPNSDFYGGTRDAVDPRSMDMRGEAQTSEGGDVRYVHNGLTLYVDQRAGSDGHPIVIKAAGVDSDYFDEFGNLVLPDRRPRIHFRLNLRSVQRLHLKNVRIIITDRVITGAGDGLGDPLAHVTEVSEDTAGEIVRAAGNVIPLQLSTIPKSERADALDTRYVLLRGCEIDGGWRPGPVGSARALVNEEVLKVNQCQHVYIERCQIHGAYGDGKNPLDVIALQYGHIIDCDIYDSQSDWCGYVKGGSAHLRIEANKIRSAGSEEANGFCIGEGTNSDAVVGPWWHYETYSIQFVNNLIYDVRGSALAIYGGYQVLIAHNTLYNAGWNAHMIELVYGNRVCPGAGDVCSAVAALADGAWATTWISEPGVPMIPNRYVYIYNNILFNPDVTSNFNVFYISPDVADYRQPQPGHDYNTIRNNPTHPPGSERTVFPPPGRLPGRLPQSAEDGGITADGHRHSIDGAPVIPWLRSLRVVGNFVRAGGGILLRNDAGDIERDADGLPRLSEWFFSPSGARRATDEGPPRVKGYESYFAEFNRVDDAVPEIVTGERNDPNFLRPTGRASNVVSAPAAVSKVESPHPPLTAAEWDAGLPPLPERTPPVLPLSTPVEMTWKPPRDPAWPAAHVVGVDYDGFCRPSGSITPGARTRLNDFYVRDWTETNSIHDVGDEPSTRAVFWTSSDVWNQTDSTASTAEPPPEVSPRWTGGNWVFARIRRNAPGPPRTVRARFMYARFGVGNFFRPVVRNLDDPEANAGVDEVTFNERETERTVSYEWNIPDDMGGHVCLAVEIEVINPMTGGREDESATPTLRGRAPGSGAGQTDPYVAGDNNKAQRNLWTEMMPTGPRGGGEEGDRVMDEAPASLYARISNASTRRRDMRIRYEIPPETAEALRGARIEVVNAEAGGGHVRQRIPAWAALTFALILVALAFALPSPWAAVAAVAALIAGLAATALLFAERQLYPREREVSGGAFTLADMQPGESRWIALTFDASKLGPAELPPVSLYETEGEATVNGFSIRVRPSPADAVVRVNLARHADTLSRAGRLFKSANADAQSASVVSSHDKGVTSGGEYLQFLRAAAGSFVEVLSLLEARGRKDIFGVRGAQRRLASALAAPDLLAATVAHADVLNRLDAWLTEAQAAQGDPAGVLHNVLWQRDLYDGSPALRRLEPAAAVLEQSERFVRAYDAGRLSNDDFPALVHELLPQFHRTAEALLDVGVDVRAEVKGMERNLGSAAQAQRAHRQYLLKLQSGPRSLTP